MWTARVFTLYPELFPGPFNYSLYKKAIDKNIWSLKVVDIREGAQDIHKTADDTSFGGGSGMIIKPDVLAKSIDNNVKSNEKIIYFSPKGTMFDHKMAKNLCIENTVNLICGHFEGVDQRILETRNIQEVALEILFYQEVK